MDKQITRRHNFGRYAVVCFWLVLIVLCLIHKDKLTVENIVTFSPENQALAAVIILGLFTLKGSTVLMNGNILYMASGVLFPLPLAIAVNIFGSIIMTTIPFLIGNRGGPPLIEKLTQKYKKMKLIRDLPKKNEFQFTLLLRILGLLPCEPVGMYLGACRLGYRNFIFGTMLGLLPAIVSYAVMGEYAVSPTSPQFLAAAGFQVGTTVCVLVFWAVWKIRAKNKNFAKKN